MIWKRLKWRFLNFVFKVFAAAQGFPDPILIVTNLRRFAQPSDLTAPKELLRAGAVMQARGLMNSQAIQHNMDWVWPYWMERQFDPNDESFLPRAFNLSHLNLTNRNWTAVGVPDSAELPIVDPRGLVTPFFDGWSVDAWVITREGFDLIPSRLRVARQEFLMIDNPAIQTTSEDMGVTLRSTVQACDESGMTVCLMKLAAFAPTGGWLVVSLRPYNPEGISFVHEIALLKDRPGWKVNDQASVHFDSSPERTHFSHYWDGDVFKDLPSTTGETKIECGVGMATAAALFEVKAGATREITVGMPLKKNAELKQFSCSAPAVDKKWNDNLNGLCQLKIPDKHFQFLYDTAVRSLILHSPLDVYPGPYTYKRFWFRDAAFILHAMLCIGMSARAEKVIDRFSLRQLHDGYFLSQDGEWDSNGEALWAMRRFCELTGREPKPAWKRSIYRAAKWIQKKRIFGKDSSVFGLLPVGFSAEHLGPNDHYYWDDFWGVAGLQAAAYFAGRFADADLAAGFTAQGADLLRCIENSIETIHKKTRGKFMPASPHRRMDAGAIGSIAAGYPLQLLDPHDAGLLNTAEFLFRECFLQGGFYQEISHSGINAYLTLHIAQIFLRAEDGRFFELMNAIASMASPTGQWPEAIHPRTKGGCMGDGQHIWAAAEWILMIRNCFVREEEEKLILCSGIPASWLTEGAELSFGPAPTSFGALTIQIKVNAGIAKVHWSGEWRAKEPVLEIRFPDFTALQARPGEDSLELQLK